MVILKFWFICSLAIFKIVCLFSIEAQSPHPFFFLFLNYFFFYNCLQKKKSKKAKARLWLANDILAVSPLLSTFYICIFFKIHRHTRTDASHTENQLKTEYVQSKTYFTSLVFKINHNYHQKKTFFHACTHIVIKILVIFFWLRIVEKFDIMAHTFQC